MMKRIGFIGILIKKIVKSNEFMQNRFQSMDRT